MSNLTIAYNGSTIFDGELAGAVTLPTAEKYLEGDIVIAGEGGGTVVSDVLEENEWSVISEVAKSGNGANYWSVGDRKSVYLSGKIGTLSVDTTLWVYIIGINHRGNEGITFQGFKTGQTGGKSVCFVDHYNTKNTSGSLGYFTVNHWGGSAYGGWKGCDMRYDLLGSTTIAPSGYGEEVTTSRVGYDAIRSSATAPKADTLMSCFPSDLRSVMQPMFIYTDNIGGTNTSGSVTSSVDYLPLLAEFEVFGSRSNANTFEQNYQSQYAYYSSGNSKVNYRHSAQSSTAGWWLRSPYYYAAGYWCDVTSSGAVNYYGPEYSLGIAPIFLV